METFWSSGGAITHTDGANTNKSVLQISSHFQFWVVCLNDTTGKQVMDFKKIVYIYTWEKIRL